MNMNTETATEIDTVEFLNTPAMDHLINTNVTTITCHFKLYFSELTHVMELPIETFALGYNEFKSAIYDIIVSQFNIENFDVVSSHSIQEHSSRSTELSEIEELMQCFPLINLPKFVANPIYISKCTFPFYIRDSNYKDICDIRMCSICHDSTLYTATTCGYICNHTLCINCYNEQLNHSIETHRCPECRALPRIQATHLLEHEDTRIAQNLIRASNTRANELLQIWRSNRQVQSV
jgi:hypothetical protein